MAHHYSFILFSICLYIYLYQRDLYFHILLCCYLASFFLSIWRTPFSSFCKGRSSDDEMPQILFIWGGLYFSFIFGQLAKYSIFGSQFFSLPLWIYQSSAFWPGIVLLRNLILWEFPCRGWVAFSFQINKSWGGSSLLDLLMQLKTNNFSYPV